MVRLTKTFAVVAFQLNIRRPGCLEPKKHSLGVPRDGKLGKVSIYHVRHFCFHFCYILNIFLGLKTMSPKESLQCKKASKIPYFNIAAPSQSPSLGFFL